MRTLMTFAQTRPARQLLLVNVLQRLSLLVVLSLLASGAGGCFGETAAPASASASADVLRQRFPDQADLVLGQGEAFVATENGFALAASPGRAGWAGVEIALPRDGSEPIVMRGFGGVEVKVREIGTYDVGETTGRAVAYRRTGGASFWTASASGVEEWLHLEASAVRRGEALAAWEIEGAAVRQRGESVEVVDAAGVVRLSVTAPAAYAAGGREIDARLVATGARIELRVDADGEAVLVDPLWVAAGPMMVARWAHTATLLGNGTVLATGGDKYGMTLKSAELYTPAANTWSLTGPMIVARYNHTATLLGDGTVLVAGGYSGPSAERYDPVTSTWMLVSSLGASRFGHTATLLPSGKVLVAGGGSLAAEQYDPATNTWSSAGSMSQDRVGHTATLLPSGKVLIAGGYSFSYDQATAELYNPATNTWSPAGSMSQGRSSHTATLLPSGKVLVAAGSNLFSADLYDPGTNTWSAAGPLIQARVLPTATLLPSGKVLVAGGTYVNQSPDVELYDPATNFWSPAAAMSEPSRYYHTATLLGNGTVLVAGGSPVGGPPSRLASCELYASAVLGSLGSVCAQAGNCQSGFCTDGVCCDGACTGTCVACSAATKGQGADGQCGPVKAGFDPGSECAAQAASSCGQNGSCNGLGTCGLHAAGTICAAASCSGATEKSASTCDGSGQCLAGGTKVCIQGYACMGTLCKTDCVDSTACAAGYVCDTAIQGCVLDVGSTSSSSASGAGSSATTSGAGGGSSSSGQAATTSGAGGSVSTVATTSGASGGSSSGDQAATTSGAGGADGGSGSGVAFGGCGCEVAGEDRAPSSLGLGWILALGAMIRLRGRRA